jgi:hypothetical protein
MSENFMLKLYRFPWIFQNAVQIPEITFEW